MVGKFYPFRMNGYKQNRIISLNIDNAVMATAIHHCHSLVSYSTLLHLLITGLINDLVWKQIWKTKSQTKQRKYLIAGRKGWFRLIRDMIRLANSIGRVVDHIYKKKEPKFLKRGISNLSPVLMLKSCCGQVHMYSTYCQVLVDR